MDLNVALRFAYANMKDLDFEQQLNNIQLNPYFNLHHLRTPKTTNNYQIQAHQQQSESDNLEEPDDFGEKALYDTPDEEEQLKINQEQCNIKREHRQDRQIKLQDEASKRNRKIRQIWTEQKYDKLLVEFRKMYLGVQSKSMRKIAEEIGFCVRTVQLKWSEYQNDKSIPSIRSALTAKVSGKRKICNKTKFYLELMRQILSQNGLLTSNEIAKIINHKLTQTRCQFYKQDLTGGNVARMLKKGNYSYQRVPYLQKNIPRSNLSQKVIIERRYQYCQLYLSFIESGAELIFLDQTEINLFLKRQYGWIKKDKQDMAIIPQGRDSNIAILCSITRRGAVGWRIFDQPLNKAAFTDTLKEIMKKFTTQDQSNKRKILIIENTCIHKMQLISLNEAVGDAFQIFYLPPQSLVYNPVECFFREVKQSLKGKNWNSKQQLIKVTKEILQDKSKFKIQAYFTRVENYVQEGLHKIRSKI